MSHIAVAMAKIDKIINGNNLDKLARKSLNSVNLDYGTEQDMELDFHERSRRTAEYIKK